jgi:radical SAM superfamily enzyme YgiQ (UPF0313 family)
MGTRSLLITYAGYPFTPSSLMPDNGYASLAAELLHASHETRILDYSTIDTINRLMPSSISEKALPIVSSIFNKISKGITPSSDEVKSLHVFDDELSKIHDQEIIRIADELSETIRKEKIQFIGLKLWNGDGYTGSVKIAEILRKKIPSLKIFAGGPHVDIFKSLILEKNECFDAISFGEGEETIIELAEFVEGKRPLGNVHNILFRENGRIIETETKRIENLDSLAYPVYSEEIYPAMAGDQKLKIIVLDESRGCPCCCHFCIQPVKSGTKVRTKSPARIIEEMRRAISGSEIRLFRYAGSATPPVLSRQIADEILKTGLDVEYTAFGNILGAKPKNYPVLKKSGCYSIFFGIESGSKKILNKGFGKPRDPADMARILKASKAAGIYTVASIIYPAPFEDEETTKETLSLLLDAKPHSAPVQFAAVYPQTRWAKSPAEYGFKFTSDDWQEKLLTYKIKLLFPPTFYDPLPYTIDGKPFMQFAFETFKLISVLEKNGILTAISDDQALMAKYAGYQNKETEFRERVRQWFLTGDAVSINTMVETINRNQIRENLSL